METVKAERLELVSLKDLKPLLALPGPCLSMYLRLSPAPNEQGLKTSSLEWKELIEGVTAKASAQGEGARELLESVGNIEEFTETAPAWAKSVALFRSEDSFRVTYLHEPVQSRAEIGPNFYIRPLLPELTKPSVFYVLALSQKNVRLLRCTLDSSEEVALPGSAVKSYDDYMDAAKPDHVSTKRGTAGVSSGSSKGIVGTTTSELERKDEYLRHFFKQVDAGVGEALRGRTEPLVPVGVDYELALYRSVNSYAHIVEDGVHGAANGLKAGEMHSRAIESIGGEYEREIDEALALYDHKAGGGASNRLKDIVTAAHDGRVVTLIVSDSIETQGVFDEETNQATGVKGNEGESQDLVNDAVVQTITHAGSVLVTTTKKMPNGAPAVAIFRY